MIKIENWNGHEIRFVWHENEWWAVAKDVARALKYKHTPHMVRLIDEDEKNTVRLTDGNVNRGNPNITIISETGIYEAAFNSEHHEAKQFKKWVKEFLKQLRQATGLEGFQVFRMLDKEHQKEAMSTLKSNLKKPVRVDFIKANQITNKAVSMKFGRQKLVKKGEMTPDMLKVRQQVLDDTVDLMAFKDRFSLNISVSEAIYNKYCH